MNTSNLPTAQADTRAGEVLIWKEGVTGKVLILNISTESLTQGLEKKATRTVKQNFFTLGIQAWQL